MKIRNDTISHFVVKRENTSFYEDKTGRRKGNRTLLLLLIGILLMLCPGNDGHAQTVSQSSLRGTTWKEVFPEIPYRKCTVTFKETYFVDHIQYSGSEAFSLTTLYYFSDTKPTSFDKSKVGKKTSGKYWVHNPAADEFFYMVLIKVSDNEMQFRSQYGDLFVYRKQ